MAVVYSTIEKDNTVLGDRGVQIQRQSPLLPQVPTWAWHASSVIMTIVAMFVPCLSLYGGFYVSWKAMDNAGNIDHLNFIARNKALGSQPAQILLLFRSLSVVATFCIQVIATVCIKRLTGNIIRFKPAALGGMDMAFWRCNSLIVAAVDHPEVPPRIAARRGGVDPCMCLD